MMTTRSLVALYGTLAQAEAVERDLTALGVSARDVSLSASAFAGPPAVPRQGSSADDRAYFEWLIGAAVPADRRARYAALIERGAVLLCVKVAESAVPQARAAMTSGAPIDIEAEAEGGLAFAGRKPGSAVPAIHDYLVGSRSAE